MGIELKKNRANNMGTLHLLAALFVMYGHHCTILGQPLPYIIGSGIQAIGVKVIFLISGYLITKSLWNIRGNRLKVSVIYAIKRLGRLYPELLGCLLFTALVVGPIFSNLGMSAYFTQGEQGIRQYITYNLSLFPIFSLPGMFASNPYPNAVNGSLWTMPVEVALYFLILIIFLSSKNETVRKCVYAVVTIVITILFLVRIAIFPTTMIVFHGTDWIQALNIAPYFLLGGMIYLFKLEKYGNLQVSSVLLLAFAGGVRLGTAAVSEALSLGIIFYLVLSLMFSSEQKLALKRIQGEYAYGMYLYGFVVQQCVAQMFFIQKPVTFANFHISFIICVLVTYVMAMISHNCVYKPIGKVIQKCVRKIAD